MLNPVTTIRLEINLKTKISYFPGSFWFDNEKNYYVQFLYSSYIFFEWKHSFRLKSIEDICFIIIWLLPLNRNGLKSIYLRAFVIWIFCHFLCHITANLWLASSYWWRKPEYAGKISSEENILYTFKWYSPKLLGVSWCFFHKHTGYLHNNHNLLQFLVS